MFALIPWQTFPFNENTWYLIFEIIIQARGFGFRLALRAAVTAGLVAGHEPALAGQLHRPPARAALLAPQGG